MPQSGIELMDAPAADARAGGPAASPAAPRRAPTRGAAARRGAGDARGATLAAICIAAAAGAALAVHYGLPTRGPIVKTAAYSGLLVTALALAAAWLGVRRLWAGAARADAWVAHTGPLLAAGVVWLCLWQLLTAKLMLLPPMYFPGPQRVLATLVDDCGQLFDSTWHSLLLLLCGYALGVLAGVVSGILIGWFSRARYWGMPALKIIGPIPATAWIPMALIFFPGSMLAGIFLIALSVWFPVTMLTASGVSNVRASHLDVARTLGADNRFLVFRVALPAAMPSIFVGLFMGLGASFLTLLVAESTGVSSGLGWYIDWARNYSDYTKVFAALIIMAAFFSTIMTILFKVRDRVLVWQKGTIKW
jgi:NitT/TauT family transport system permease protein